MADFRQNVVPTFTRFVVKAFLEFQDHLFGSPFIPEWRRIEVALEGVLAELVHAFENPLTSPGGAAPESAK